MTEAVEEKEIEKNGNGGENNINVFLIDDDRFLLDMYSLKFKKAGISVEVAFNGLEALKRLREGFSPSIIVLDVIMPGMDGMELLETIQKEKLSIRSTIVVLTNQADDSEKAKNLGADGFIVKAMNIPSEVVKQVLGIYNEKK